MQRSRATRRDGSGRAATSTARAGASARWPTTRCSSRRRQRNMAGTGIATFGDGLRDAVRGGGPHDTPDPRRPRASPAAARATAGRALEHAQEESSSRCAGRRRLAPRPRTTIAYVDAHDNETLFDALALKLPQATTMADRVRMNTLALATVTLSASARASGTRAPSCCARSRWTATATTAATGSTASTGPRRTRRSARACRRRWDNESRWPYHAAAAGRPGAQAAPAPHPRGPRPRARAAAHPRIIAALRRRRGDRSRPGAPGRDRDGARGRDRRRSSTRPRADDADGRTRARSACIRRTPSARRPTPTARSRSRRGPSQCSLP